MKKTNAAIRREIESRIDEYVPATGESLAIGLKLIADAKAAAKAKKDAVINTRVNQADLDKFKELADEMRIPYQTLLGHLIHEYVEHRLVAVQRASDDVASKVCAYIDRKWSKELRANSVSASISRPHRRSVEVERPSAMRKAAKR